MSTDDATGVEYQYLLGKAFRLQDQLYIASALSRSDGVDMVRASTRVKGEDVMRVFPARVVVEHLVYDEEIELGDVGLINWA
jgi:hypothetical protein